VPVPVLDRRADAAPLAGARPYFVMELVRGVPITDFCDQHRYSPRQRLALFVTVCQAVQHAHQKGVIHRDLKPSNILVTLHDTVAVPKIIDFGIAKATTQPLTERTLFTHFAQMVGTPQYMSPEQAQMNGLDVDTRSDVYALGVLLYELLTGTTPFDSETLKQAGFDEMRRLICEEDPPRPSQRVSTLAAAALTTLSDRRGVDGRRFGQTLRGELDWVVMKALEKDRTRRYESAGALAADVQRYLDDEPVEAYPPTAWYRVQKMTRRHRRMLVTAGLFAVTLVAATGVTTWLAVKAHLAEQRAANEAAIANAVNDFLQTDLLGQATSAPQAHQDNDGDPNLTVKEALDRAAARIGERFQDQPLVEAAIRSTIGAAYNNLDELQFALSHLERAVAVRQAQLGPAHPDTLKSKQVLALVYEGLGRLPEAFALHQQILENRTALLGPNHTDTLVCMHNLAIAYRKAGQWATSVRLLEQLLQKQQTYCGPTHPGTVDTMHTLAMSYGDLGRIAESVALHEKVWDVRKSMVDPQRSETIWPLQTLGSAYHHAEKLDQADLMFREALELRRKRNDFIGRKATARALDWLGRNLIKQQRHVEAEPLIREALAICESDRPDHWERFCLMSVLGDVLFGQKRHSEAEPLLLQGYEGMKNRDARITAPNRRRLTEAGRRIVGFYETTVQPEKARVWRENLSLGGSAELRHP
jgi:tetratricopeptide (TPR) repeat protein